jgi:hypothetical protein
VAAKTEQERLFGAACLRVTLERAGLDPSSHEIYQGALSDLKLQDAQVVAFLSEGRAQVESALDRSRTRGG